MGNETSSCKFTIKCKLAGAEVPEPMNKYYSFEQYQKLIGPLREYVYSLEYGKVRAEGAGVGAGIGAASSAPFAMGVSIATLGLGAPVSLLILGAGAAIGAITGAVSPIEADDVKKKVRWLVEDINKQTEPLGFYMKDPLKTNDIGPAKSPKDIVDIEWVFL